MQSSSLGFLKICQIEFIIIPLSTYNQVLSRYSSFFYVSNTLPSLRHKSVIQLFLIENIKNTRMLKRCILSQPRNILSSQSSHKLIFCELSELYLKNQNCLMLVLECQQKSSKSLSAEWQTDLTAIFKNSTMFVSEGKSSTHPPHVFIKYLIKIFVCNLCFFH